ncbi:MAG: hypothetical protein WD425_11960 [Nitrospirales bacterium]
MPNTNASFSSFSRVDSLKKQMEKLENLSQSPVDQKALEKFDQETQEILKRIDGKEENLTAYQFATMAEAEALVNLPESAQEPTSRDLLQKSIQQRRQMLLGLVREMENLEEKEKEVLTGEDSEDPPLM